MVSILLGLGERCCSWQNWKHQKGISSREEGGEFYIKYMGFELMFAYWIDPFIRWTGAYIRSKDKSKTWLPSDHWSYDDEWAFWEYKR